MEVVSYKYSIPYLVFLVYLLVLMFVEFHRLNRKQGIEEIRILTMAGFLFFYGLRGFVNTDWLIYYPYFENLNTIWDGNIIDRFEWGFNIYSIVIKSIYPNYFFWVFAGTLIDVVIIHILVKRYSQYYVLAFIAYIVFGGDVLEMNLMRNVKSILLFLLSIRYLQERKIVPYMLLNILGVLFHISSVIYLPMYFFIHREFPKTLLWIVFISGNIIFLLHLQYIEPLFTFAANIVGGRAPLMVKLYFTLRGYTEPYGISLGYIERVVTMVVVILLYQKLKEQNRSNIIFANIYVLYFACFFYFAEVHTLMSRMVTLFSFSYVILYPNLYALVKILSNKSIIISVLILFFAGKIIKGSDTIFVKYDNLLFGIESYETRKNIMKKYYQETTLQRFEK